MCGLPMRCHGNSILSSRHKVHHAAHDTLHSYRHIHVLVTTTQDFALVFKLLALPSYL
jgi:glutaminase